MALKISTYGIQIFVLICVTTSNRVNPEYSVKILNTETVILSLGDPDDAKNNDLEIIKASPGKSALEKKMGKFHKYVNLVEMTENPEQRYFSKSFNKLKNYVPLLSASYPDSSPESEDGDEKRLRRPTRRKKKRKKKRLRSMNFPRFMTTSRIKKREVDEEKMSDEEGYDYLQKDYLDFVNESLQQDTAFKYSDEGKPEESFKEIIYKITDVKTPENCTEFNGIGLQALECIIKNFKSGQLDQKQMIYAISLIVLIWFGLYLAVALPLWCVKGWCCCCCRCEFCLPNQTVREIQKYIVHNPPGIYINSEGVEEHYNPTQNEIELYERLKRSVGEF